MDTRVLGLDLARFVAIAGMIVAHTVPEQTQGPVVDFLVDGNASTLFALASGVSAVLASRRYLAVGAAGRARVSLAIRGLCLVVVGVALGTLPQQAVIVLVYLGLALILAAPFLTAPPLVLASVCVVLAAVVPPLNLVVRRGLGTLSEGFSLSIPDLADPARMLRAAFLTGTYPALTWLVFVLIGMLIGRALVRTSPARRLPFALWLVGGGIVAAVAGVAVSWMAHALGPLGVEGDAFGAPNPPVPAALLWDQPHSGTVPDLLRGTGVAAAVLGLCLLLCWSTPAAARWLRPAIGAGAAPLSSYVLHILTLSVVAALAGSDSPPPWWQYGWGAALLNVAIVLALGAALGATRRRGPFELLISRIADRMPRESQGSPTVWQWRRTRV